MEVINYVFANNSKTKQYIIKILKIILNTINIVVHILSQRK